MYFNDEKNNTNNDKELSGSTIVNFLRINLKKILIIIAIFILIIILLLIFRRIRNGSGYTFELLGNSNMKIYQNSEFIDPGFIAFDKNGNDVSNLVKIKGTINTEKVGTYTLKYILKGKSIDRIVKVVEKTDGDVGIFLKGNLVVNLSKGEEYIEPGYVCLDSIDGDITDQVEVSNNVDVNTLGMYKIIYKVENSSGITVMVSRVVIVE